MQVTLEGGNATYRIHAYDEHSVTIAVPKQLEDVPEGHQDDDIKLAMWRDTLHNSLVVTPERLIRDWASGGFEQLTEQDFADLLPFQPEIVLLGTGQTLRRPSAALLAPLINAGIGIEIMGTGAACRTYNILMADERRVVTALIME